MKRIDVAGRYADPGETGAKYVEHLRRADLSLGTYSLRVGAVDRQSPHGEDEVYVVKVGRAKFTSGSQTVDVGPGSVLFVPANERHRFHDLATDLAALVFFGPAEGHSDAAADLSDLTD
jgi:mannose-6-phosphate isomerase-like protein (cupin superfamily)